MFILNICLILVTLFSPRLVFSFLLKFLILYLSFTVFLDFQEKTKVFIMYPFALFTHKATYVILDNLLLQNFQQNHFKKISIEFCVYFEIEKNLARTFRYMYKL